MNLVAGIPCVPSKRLSLVKVNLQSSSPNDTGAALPTQNHRIQLDILGSSLACRIGCSVHIRQPIHVNIISVMVDSSHFERLFLV
jgi:hypothetical protein